MQGASEGDRDAGEPSTSTSPPRSEEEDRRANAEAEALKAKGNQDFAEGWHREAAKVYREALALRPSDRKLESVLHANLAACLVKLDQVRDRKYILLNFGSCIGSCASI